MMTERTLEGPSSEITLDQSALRLCISRANHCLVTRCAELHSMEDSPEGDAVKVLSEMGQVKTLLFILLFGPHQDLRQLNG